MGFPPDRVGGNNPNARLRGARRFDIVLLFPPVFPPRRFQFPAGTARLWPPGFSSTKTMLPLRFLSLPSRRLLALAATACVLPFLNPPSAQAVVWGVAGHEPTGAWPVYRDVPASQQLDLVNAIGATYYRSTSSTALLNLIQGNSAYANIRLLPILGTGFSNTDFQQNPNGYTNAVFYSNARQHAIDWVNSYSAYNPFPFDCVEIANELDNVCILSGRSGSSPNDYDSVIFGRIESAVQGLCDGVRAANPTVPRAFGCAGWLHYGFLDRLITDLGAPDWEKVVYHWYSNMGLISSHSDVVSKLQGYATTYNTPTWITETDCVSGSNPLTGETTAQAERRQAGAMEDLVQDMKQLSFIHVICMYELIDEPNNGATEAHYGIYRAAKVNNVYTVTGAKPDVLSAYRGAWSIDDGAIYELEPRHAAGMRLDVAGGSGLNGANVDIFHGRQFFRPALAIDIHGKCLVRIRSALRADDAPRRQWRRHRERHQRQEFDSERYQRPTLVSQFEYGRLL